MYNIFSFKELFQNDCTFSLTEQNIAINDHNDAMILAYFESNYSPYYSNLSLIRTSIVATIVLLVDCLVPSSSPI